MCFAFLYPSEERKKSAKYFRLE